MSVFPARGSTSAVGQRRDAAPRGLPRFATGRVTADEHGLLVHVFGLVFRPGCSHASARRGGPLPAWAAGLGVTRRSRLRAGTRARVRRVDESAAVQVLGETWLLDSYSPAAARAAAWR